MHMCANYVYIYELICLVVALFLFSFCTFVNFFQVREMEKKKEGKPGEARAAMRRPLRENEYVPYYTL